MAENKPTLEDWQALAAKEGKGRDLNWPTPEGIDVKPLYTAADVEGIDPGLPGFAPFTRGVRASMYAGRPWTIRQYAGFSTAEAFALAERLAAGPTVAMGLMRRQIRTAYENDYASAMLQEAENQRAARGTADSMEGGIAFLQKRKAAFRGA